ncbi:MAG: zf-HC2 domain-containing protein [Nocardioides sp.]
MADLTCQQLVELVTDHLDGALDDETADRFEQHVARCPGCHTYLSQMRETAALLETFRDLPR